MHIRRLLPLCLIAIVFVSGATLDARGRARTVPFKGFWIGETISADETTFPVVAIVSEGSGLLTHVGRYSMFSPHTSNVFTGFTEGLQIFTAPNGDTLTAYCAGTPLPDDSSGTLTVSGTLDCEIESGTGRFEDATGSYEFHLFSVLQPEPLPSGGLKFFTVAAISGRITY